MYDIEEELKHLKGDTTYFCDCLLFTVCIVIILDV